MVLKRSIPKLKFYETDSEISTKIITKEFEKKEENQKKEEKQKKKKIQDFKNIKETIEKIKNIEKKEKKEEKKKEKKKSIIKVGSTIEIFYRENKHLQKYEGLVIAKKNKGINKTFTIRKVVDGIGVEQIFFVSSPKIEQIKKKASMKVRRAKLNYLRK